MKTQNFLFFLCLFTISFKSFPQNPNTIRINLKTATNDPIDNVVVRFFDDPTVTYGESSYWDVRSLNIGTMVASMKGNVSFAINTRPLNFDRDTVRLRVESSTVNSYKLVFANYSNFVIAKEIYLLDNFTGMQQEIKANPVYDFSISPDPASKGTNRFKLVFVSQQIMINCPAPIVVNNTTGMNGANVDFSVAASAKCSATSIQYGVAPNSFFPIGTTNVPVTAYDICGNSASCEVSITVKDNEPPIISAPESLTFNTDPGKANHLFTITAPFTTDNSNSFSISGVRADARPLADTYPIGNTIITWTATDNAGNSSSRQQLITVKDTEPPVLVIQNRSLNTDAGQCSATSTVAPPVVTDNSGSASVTGSRSDNSLLTAPFSKGQTVITWTASDLSGNISVATQTITVSDNEVPVINTKTISILTANFSGCTYKITDASFDAAVTDNCTGVMLRNNVNNTNTLAGLVFSNGTTTVTWTATDASGNIATYHQQITVIKPSMTVSIPDAVVLPQGVAANTIYYGYTPAATLQLNAMVNPGYSYTWSVTSNLAMVAPQGLSSMKIAVNLVNASPYQATVMVKDVNGCSITVTKTLAVIDVRCGAKLDKISVCSPQNKVECTDAKNVPGKLITYKLGSCNTLRNVEVPVAGIKIFPNPSTGVFSLMLNNYSNDKVELMVFDISGKMIMQRSLMVDSAKEKIMIDLNKYPAGIYNAQVFAKGESRSIKLVVAR